MPHEPDTETVTTMFLSIGDAAPSVLFWLIVGCSETMDPVQLSGAFVGAGSGA
jgi:hypothetical protein